jgi:alkylation response protein AidB-like acyl-CoA dehydrogenase
MLDWTDEHKMLRDAIRSFVDKEIVPLREELEHGDLPPYGVLRKLFATFGIDEMARDGFAKRLERDLAPRTTSPEAPLSSAASGFDPALMMILLIELSRCCPGMVTALGVSAGLTASAIDSRGTPRQRERWVPDLLTLDSIGAWALT